MNDDFKIEDNELDEVSGGTLKSFPITYVTYGCPPFATMTHSFLTTGELLELLKKRQKIKSKAETNTENNDNTQK